ncbi:alpha/beta hydrolase [Sciscionella sediminilitoris]|uniref:alpha/beta hydrolase n=1 Tax=Sciscionella sediminilitoris TaxID=1445613 RepID=UPI0004DFA435|nr:alpha/beta hydrolase [Sciscionella sp. SE31]
MPRTMFLAAVAVLAAALPGTAPATPGALHWGSCPATVTGHGLECASLTVPLDYRNPHGRTITIGISRLPSSKPAQRRGVLLTNPGGPDPGMNYPAKLAEQGLPQSVRERYDVIGFDPRGFGNSAPVTCDLTAAQSATGIVPPYARNTADVLEQAAASKRIAGQCARSKTAWLRPFISTANTARDMDRIRAALGEPRISFLGDSWGTHLGAVYTTLFPRRGDRIVLDSNLSPGGWTYPYERLYGQGFQDRFPDFAKFAPANPRYGLGSTPEQVTAKYFTLAARLDRKPVDGLDGQKFRFTTWAALFGDQSLRPLAEIWHRLDTGRALPAAPPATGPAPDPDNETSGQLYMTCADSRWPTSIPSYVRHVAIDRIRYPMFGAAGANIQPCAFWPNPPEPPVHIGDRGPSNVLMVQNLRDPVTPLAGARKLRRAFGQRARMITADQGGHGVYLLNHNNCANNAVTTFLTTGKRPAHDHTCPAGQPAG